MERLIERGLFASRWMMAPMYLGLALALVILVWIFLMELVRFVMIVPVMTVNDAILGVLALIDLSLAANLLLIVIFSGYENFVSKLDLDAQHERPSWMGTVDFSGLKMKLIASIVASGCPGCTSSPSETCNFTSRPGIGQINNLERSGGTFSSISCSYRASRSGSTSVSGPGHQRSASARAASSNTAIRSAAARSGTWTISGLKLGRPLAR